MGNELKKMSFSPSSLSGGRCAECEALGCQCTGNHPSALSGVAGGVPSGGEPHQVLKKIISGRNSYRALLKLKKSEAEKAFSIMQKVLDAETTPDDLKPIVIVAMMRLLMASAIFPQSLILQGVEKSGNQPFASGGFGEVWRGNYNGIPVALKAVKLGVAGTDPVQLTKDTAREAIMWSQLAHPNVLPLYGVSYLGDERNRPCLVAPWMQSGSIDVYLKANPQTQRLPLVMEVMEGLHYLHEHQIVHSDLKSANVLISPTGSARLADFGISSVVDPAILRATSLNTMTKTGGALRWTAPELLDDRSEKAPRPTFASDVYSLASVMYEILTGNFPFYEITSEDTVTTTIIEGKTPAKPSTSSKMELNDRVWTLMLRCWSFDPTKRPTAKEAIDELRKANMGALERLFGGKKIDLPSTKLVPQTLRPVDRNPNFPEDEVRLLNDCARR